MPSRLLFVPLGLCNTANIRSVKKYVLETIFVPLTVIYYRSKMVVIMDSVTIALIWCEGTGGWVAAEVCENCRQS